MRDYGSEGMSMTLRPIRSIAQAVTILLAAQIVLAVIEAITLLNRIDLLHRIQAGEVIGLDDGRNADSAVTAVTSIDSLVFIATVIVWCIWQHRAQRNAIDLTTGGLRFSPGWAVGWWFIPIANLWKPFQTVRELWKASHGGDAWRTMATWPVIGWWWAIWIASNIHVWFGTSGASLGFGTSTFGTPITAADVISRDTWEIVSLALEVPAAILAIMIVRSVGQAQDAAPRRAPATVQPLPDPPLRPDVGTT
jgi:hypothetical protein